MPSQDQLQPENAPTETPGSADAAIAVINNVIDAVPVDTEMTVRGDDTLGILNNYLTLLPPPTDDIDSILTSDIKGKMMMDAIINSTLNWLASAALDRGLQFAPLIRDKEDPNYKQSMKAYDVAMRSMDEYEDDMVDVIKDGIVSTLGWGNKIFEKSCALGRGRDGVLRYSLRSVKPRAEENVGFIVDPHGNTIGVAGKTVGKVNRDGTIDNEPVTEPSLANGVLALNGSNLPSGWKAMPRSKFMVMTYRPKDGDPRGTSILRHIYNEWYLIQAIMPHYLKYLMKFASPSVVGKTSEAARPMTRGGTAPVDKLYADLKQFQNSSVMALPFGYDLELLYSQGGGEAFVTAFGVLERRMVRGMTNQTLASGESRNMARAASTTHQDQQNVVVRDIKQMAAFSVRRDILRFLIRINEGEELSRFAPVSSLGGVAPEDQAEMLDKASLAWSRGFVHPSQLRGLDAEIGLPFREIAEPGFFPSSAVTQEGFEAGPEPATAPGTANPAKSGEAKPEKKEDSPKPKPD